MECSSCSFGSSSSLLLPSSRLPPCLLPSKLKLSRLKQRRRLAIRIACEFNENASANGFPVAPNKLFVHEAIGAEYGEGFETFRHDGPLKVDVDFLNDRLQEGFLRRIRYAMKPDEAYGLIFSWDNVVVFPKPSVAFSTMSMRCYKLNYVLFLDSRSDHV
uniref:Haloacid dehalogenase-like hydrolase superfamily protein n=1 Tax=Rhizophora mucronata TaxID=61149 RepID=A0A2P2JTT3_RHIMU